MKFFKKREAKKQTKSHTHTHTLTHTHTQPLLAFYFLVKNPGNSTSWGAVSRLG